jgi:hypothetical protein
MRHFALIVAISALRLALAQQQAQAGPADETSEPKDCLVVNAGVHVKTPDGSLNGWSAYCVLDSTELSSGLQSTLPSMSSLVHGLQSRSYVELLDVMEVAEGASQYQGLFNSSTVRFAQY